MEKARGTTMTKYKIQLSMYGTIAERANVEIEAHTKEEAERIALKQAENGDIEFSDPNCVDGYEIQIEDCIKNE